MNLDDILSKLTSEEKEYLSELILKDELTGIKNRRAFDLEALHEIERAERIGYDVTLLMLDIDYFKKVNDEFGHQEGDKVLRRVAQAINTATRGYDTAYRYGGEEFAVVLPNTSIGEGFSIADRIRELVPTLAGVTISIGLSNYKGTSGSLAEFVNHSDTALYRSKNNGRNRITIYGRE